MIVDVARPLKSGGNDRRDASHETYIVADTLQGYWQEPGAGLVNERSGVRRLTEREAERLQGFPDDYSRLGHDGKEIPSSARYRALGNAVAVPVVEWILKRLKEADTCKYEPIPG